MNVLTQIVWGSPAYFILMPVIVLAALLLFYRAFRMRQALTLLSTTQVVISGTAAWRTWCKTIFFAAGLLLLVLALMRPQWGLKQEKTIREGRDLFIALDVSRSMLANDCDPDRLTSAKKKIKQLLAQLGCERVGLILFSGSAFVQCPLTTDYGSFSLFLDNVDVESISSGTTALDQAIKEAIKSFGNAPSRKTKLLVVITDGEDFSSNLHAIKTQAQSDGVKIFTLGIGTTEGAPIPLYDERGKAIGHQRDAKGAVVISRLNEGMLQTLAQDAGGVYVRARSDSQELKHLVECIHQFEREKLEENVREQREDRYHYFLLGSLLCFLIEWLL